MSEKKNAANAAQNQKVMTKYDLKMQRRKEEAQKAKKEEIRGMIIGIVLVVALAAFVLSFPIRNYLATNQEFVKIGGERVTRVEFEMQYSMAKNTYIQQMGPYLSMFGMTDLSSLEWEAYDENMTFGDYFAQMAAENLVQQKGMIAKAKEAGFTHDVSTSLEKMKTNLEEAALEEGVSFDAYVTSMYGSLATWKRIKPYLEDSLYASAYYNKIVEENMPTEEEIQAEYEANKAEYDSVDYRLTIVNAELPTTAPDGTVPKDEEGNEIAYEPTEEEIEAAMKIAYEKAQEAQKTVAKDGTEHKGVRLSSASTYLSEFLADESRKAGDTTIAELSSTNRYWVAAYGDRYLDESPTYDVRMIYTVSKDAQEVLDEWKAGEATEESFAKMVTRYDETGMASDGGYYSGLNADDLEDEMKEWLIGERAAGDTFAVTLESGEGYVLYYVGENDPVWKLDAMNKLLSADMTVFTEAAVEGIEIEDKKEKLAYLHIEEEVVSEE